MTGRGRITRESLDRLNDAVPLAAFIGESVTLRRVGGKFQGQCPFHQDSSPSFFVMEDHYYCFGCQAHGKAIDFEMHRTGATFPEAVENLAQRYNVTLDFEGGADDGKAAEAYRRRQSLVAVMQEVAAFYTRCLNHSSGSAAKSYLTGERRLSEETLTLFGIGYAPQKNTLEILASKKGWSISSLQDLGLLKASERSPGRNYDVLRSRVTIPIHDEKGAPIGFGARILPALVTETPGGQLPASSGSTGPKYLNSPETVLFNKSQTVFNLHRARKSMLQKREVLVVEGYMDVIGLVQAGIPNVVAVLGTALTAEHIRLLSKYVDHVILCFDNDSAGQKATMRSFEVGWPLNLVRMSAFTLDEGAKDPDEFVQKFGLERLVAAMQGARPLLQWAIQRATAGLAYREDRLRAVRKTIIPIIERMPGKAEQLAALRDVAETLGLPGPAGLITKPQGSRRSPSSPSLSGSGGASAGPSPGSASASSSPAEFTPPLGAPGARATDAAPPSEAPQLARLKVQSAAELRFLVLVAHATKGELPATLSNLYSGTVGHDVTDDLITLRTLQTILSPAALQALDELMQKAMCGDDSSDNAPGARAQDPFPTQFQIVRLCPEKERSPLAHSLLAFRERDYGTLEAFGIDPKTLESQGASTQRFTPEVSVFDQRNLGFLRFLFRNAEQAQIQQTIASQLAKILVDLEIAYLDRELAEWASVETVRSSRPASQSTVDSGRYRRVMEERAKRLLAK